MKTCAYILCILLLADSVGGQTKGIKPRGNPEDFPGSAKADNFIVAAAQLSRTEVAHAFATELGDAYVVVEVQVFPAKGEVTVNTANFFLTAENTKLMLRPAEPKTVAAVLQKPTGRDVTLYPTAEVGYQSGPDIYGRRQSGVTTGVGMGVGISDKEKKSDADRKVMETELSDKSLPSGATAKPVAGYLYFPVSTAKRAAYTLHYEEGESKLAIQLSQPAK